VKRKPSPKKKKPMKNVKVDLHGVPFEQALGALLKTPPPIKKWKEK
jgi:hypothetical protein